MLLSPLAYYLLGSIPFGYLLVKIFLDQDIRETGSGNTGATNVARSGKKGLAVATLLLDAGKGSLATLLAVWLAEGTVFNRLDIEGLPGVLTSLAALFAVLGHCFPVWLRFRGGKGVATAVGAFAVVQPRAVLIALGCFILVFAVTRYVSLASIVSTFSFPVAAYFFIAPAFRPQIVGFMLVTSLLIILKHHGNIRRLIAGTEPKFGAKAIGTTDPGATEKSI